MILKEIAIVNLSKQATNDQCAIMSQACDIQLSTQAAPSWWRSAVPVTFYPDATKVPNSSSILTISDVATDPDALGYHTENADRMIGYVFVNPVIQDGGGEILPLYTDTVPCSVVTTLSHEVLELFINPYVNEWVDGPQIKAGSEYSKEIADPVESDQYLIQVGADKVPVSNFILPSWFDDQAEPGQEFDFMGKLTAPFSMTQGGYMVVRSKPGAEKQVFGCKVSRDKITWKRANPVSRTKRICSL